MSTARAAAAPECHQEGASSHVVAPVAAKLGIRGFPKIGDPNIVPQIGSLL